MPEETAVIDPPATETPKATGNPGQSVTLNLFKGKKPAETPEPAKTEEPTKAPETTTQDAAKKPKANDVETNLGNMRKKLEEYEAQVKATAEERDKIRTEYETFKSKPPELPEEVKTKLTAVEKYEKELADMRALVRQTNLAADPDFREKYDKGIQNRIANMWRVAAAAGITEAEWKSAVSRWDKDKFGEWMDGMSPGQRMEFQAAWLKSEELYQEQQEQLQNADKTLAELEKQRRDAYESQQREVFTRNETLARNIMKSVLANGDAASYEGISEAMESTLLKAARHEVTAEEIFTQLAANQVLARSTQKQAETIKERDTRIAELEQKLAEQEEFIKQHSGSVPRPDAAGRTGDTAEKHVPLWKNVVVTR